MLARVVGLVVCAAVLGMGATSWAQGESRGGDQGEKKEEKKDEKFKPYDEVIKEGAETKTGLVIAHLQDGKVFYELASSALDRDMLWVTSIAGTRAGHSYAGMPVTDRVVTWEQRGEDKILLREVLYEIRADTDDPISLAVQATSLSPIIQSFDILAWGKDKRPVIEVTDLFTSDVAEFTARGALDAGRMDSKRSFVETVKVFPENVNTTVLATYEVQAEGGAADRARTGAVTALISHSMVLLPDDTMSPRGHDSRVGFFSVGFTDYADMTNHEAEQVRYITRWRLEKKDPEAEVSEPVEPIVFYVGRAVPEKLKPYVKAGIEQWQPAFEAAGFRNAIIGKYAPTVEEDPDWDAEDARISSIRWLPADIENAFGPHVSDPRTGQILEADVRMYHNVMKLVRDWYFVQAAACDERAQQLPMPDDLMGELVQFVVAHEVGHSLGLPHNFKASSSYTVEQLRDPEWTKANGTAPSIMDYARFNYVAQPGDGAALMPAIGAYDFYSINWGYRQFAEDAEEKAALEALCKEQIEEPIYRFGGGFGDPSSQTEDLTGDAVEATELGMANLRRVAGFMVEACCDEGEDYDLLENMYGELWGQWNREMGHVANYVGGIEQINLYYGDADKRYFEVEPDKQRQAAAFLIENALGEPDEAMVSESIALRLSPVGVADRVGEAQGRVMRSLLNPGRIDRMSEVAERVGEDAYTPAELMDDVRKGVFSEFAGRTTEDPSLYRRNLQRSLVEMLIGAMDGAQADSDLPALARWQLKAINGMLKAAGGGATETTRAHVIDLSARIEEALNPTGAPPATTR
jgi:hypothetical protein